VIWRNFSFHWPSIFAQVSARWPGAPGLAVFETWGFHDRNKLGIFPGVERECRVPRVHWVLSTDYWVLIFSSQTTETTIIDFQSAARDNGDDLGQ
jgi:hypothetical protein